MHHMMFYSPTHVQAENAQPDQLQNR